MKLKDSSTPSTSLSESDIARLIPVYKYRREIELIKYLKAAPKPEWLEMQKIWGKHTGIECENITSDLVIEGLISFSAECALVPTLRLMYGDMKFHNGWRSFFRGESISEYNQMWLSYLCMVFISAEVDKIKGWS